MKRIRYSEAENRTGGYLTVFLGLALPVILSLFFVLIEGARMNAIRMQIECVTDAAVNSVLAEFNRELYAQYDLFFVDTSYGTQNADEENTRRRLQEYMEKNFRGELSLFGSRRDFTNLSVSSLEITGTRFAADEDAGALREQITAYMSAEPIGELAAGFLQMFDTFNGFDFDVSEWHRKKEENDEFLANATAPPKDAGHTDGEEDEEEEEEVPVGNPGDKVNEYRLAPLLYQIFGSTSNVSEAYVDTGTLLSNRGIHAGSALDPENSHHYQRADALLFDQYVMEKCGNYRHNEKKNLLKYQAEYILFGDGSDKGNLEKMAAALLAVREAANCIYLFGDAGKGELARMIAAVIATVLLNPELTEAFKIAILFAWAYLESIQDLKDLFAGGRVPLMKDDSTWKTSIWGILTPAAATTPRTGGKGLSYENYLRIFLYMKGGSIKNERLMDVMEMDVRQASGNNAFRMDYCLDAFELAAQVRSSFGYSYEIRRAVTYN